MRRLIIGMLALTATSKAAAQPVALPAEQLAPILRKWEQRMNASPTHFVRCTQTLDDKVFEVREVRKGWAKCMKPNLAALFLQKEGKPQVYEKWVCDGQALYEYVPAQKLIRKHPLPKHVQSMVEGALPFVFGILAKNVQERFDIKLMGDERYYYLYITPRLQADRAQFTRARIVLARDTCLPRQIHYRQVNDNEITWEVEFDTKARVARRDFVVVPEQGWRILP